MYLVGWVGAFAGVPDGKQPVPCLQKASIAAVDKALELRSLRGTSFLRPLNRSSADGLGLRHLSDVTRCGV